MGYGSLRITPVAGDVSPVQKESDNFCMIGGQTPFADHPPEL